MNDQFIDFNYIYVLKDKIKIIYRDCSELMDIKMKD